MSDTPRTDNAALCWERDKSYIGATVPTEFARELEREVEAWKASFAKKDADFQEAKRSIAKLTELIMRVDADSWDRNIRLDGQTELVALASRLRPATAGKTE